MTKILPNILIGIAISGTIGCIILSVYVYMHRAQLTPSVYQQVCVRYSPENSFGQIECLDWRALHISGPVDPSFHFPND